MTFDLQWKEAMVELLDQLQELDPEAEGSEAFNKLQEASDVEKFQMYATLYIRYLQIFRALEESYDMTVHPQKRMDIRKDIFAPEGGGKGSFLNEKMNGFLDQNPGGGKTNFGKFF